MKIWIEIYFVKENSKGFSIWDTKSYLKISITGHPCLNRKLEKAIANFDAQGGCDFWVGSISSTSEKETFAPSRLFCLPVLLQYLTPNENQTLGLF